MSQPFDSPRVAEADHRRPIRALDPGVVERIAAGEVIERPASVVRELIENALDAGANSIRIELREGGLRLVRVGDDGCGIPADELALASAPHATSKLRQPDDLAHVMTLGFRGEALASIAAVAHLRLASAETESGLAATLALVAGGGEAERGFEPRLRGTSVTVRDLFQAVPARRAALLGPRGEERLALAVIRGYALAHPGVRFTVIAEGTVLLQTPGTSAAAAVSAIYGADVARGLLALGPLPVEGGMLDGWLAPRAFTQADRAHVLLSVNGRPVRTRSLVAAMEAGYRPLLRKGRHPILLAALTLDPALVDVNIHPTKAEVLAHGERALATVLREAVHTTLGQAPAQVAPPLPPAAALYTRARQYPLPLGRRRRGRLAEPRPHYPASGHAADSPPSGALPDLEPLGQIDGALIVATTPDGQLYLVDQHRAHERLLYDALHYEAAPAGDAASGSGQLLLEPLVIELAPRQAEVLASRIVELAVLGLTCEPFGGSTFLVRALPAVPGAAVGPAAFADELAAAAAEDAVDWRDHFRASLACRAALRRGQTLSIAEQRALLADLRGASATAACPHGSPILLRYTHGFFARVFEW
jgi:DNA mismatch repair protein MutL